MKLLVPFLVLTLRLSSGKNFIYRTAFFWNSLRNCWLIILFVRFCLCLIDGLYKDAVNHFFLQGCVLFLIVLCKYLWWLNVCSSSMPRKAGPKVMCAADLCPAGTRPALFVAVLWPKQAITAHWTTSSARRAESWFPPLGTRLGCCCCPAWTWRTVPSAVHSLWTAGIRALASFATGYF